MGDDERKQLTFKEAKAMLPKGSQVHTFIQAGSALIGAHWERQDILDAFEKFGVELSGAQATAMQHGLVFFEDGTRPVFVETRKPTKER